MADKRNVVVVGAGVVGLACGLRLGREGFDVTLVDPGPPGEGASAGNPGAISLSSISPTATPGVLAKVPGWLLDPDGPLVLRWRHLPFMLPWLALFLRNGTPQRAAAAMRALASLTHGARRAWQPLLEAAAAASLLRDAGHLVVYRAQAAHDAENAVWRKRAELGFASRSVDAADLASLEPALDRGFVAGRLVDGNSQIADPLELCRRLAAAIQSDGRIVRDEVRDFEMRDGRVIAVRGRRASYPADLVVLAAGAHSAKLARTLGDDVPLQPERGYNATLHEAPFALARPIFSPGDKLVAASVTPGLRFAGTAEFAGFAAAPNYARADSLARLGRSMFPALRDYDGAQSAWAGFRPSTPDSLPVIGPASRARGAILAFGHGHVGLTTAAITADIVAALTIGAPPPIDIAAFSPARF